MQCRWHSTYTANSPLGFNGKNWKYRGIMKDSGRRLRDQVNQGDKRTQNVKKVEKAKWRQYVGVYLHFVGQIVNSRELRLECNGSASQPSSNIHRTMFVVHISRIIPISVIIFNPTCPRQVALLQRWTKTVFISGLFQRNFEDSSVGVVWVCRFSAYFPVTWFLISLLAEWRIVYKFHEVK